jgi:TIR domain
MAQGLGHEDCPPSWDEARDRGCGAPSAALSRQVPAASNDSQVFVSYSHQDGRAVEQLVQQIEQLGYAVWIDRQSAGSQRYAAPIVRAIRTSKLVALMCSQNAFASDHVIREVYVAGDYKKPFIAFQLDSTEFPDEVLYFVSGFPRLPVDVMDPQQLGSEIARLVAA